MARTLLFLKDACRVGTAAGHDRLLTRITKAIIIIIGTDNGGAWVIESRVDLILHPVRMRIIQILVGREMTTQEIAKSMPDVPPATLYRHVGLLAQGNIIHVVAENRVRGAIERVYVVALDQVEITEEDLRHLERDDHQRMFMSFIASVIGGFQRYLGQGRIDLRADGVSYRRVTLYLDDDEFRRFAKELVAVVKRAVAHRPRPGRRQRTVSTIIVPEPRDGAGSQPIPAEEQELE